MPGYAQGKCADCEDYSLSLKAHDNEYYCPLCLADIMQYEEDRANTAPRAVFTLLATLLVIICFIAWHYHHFPTH